MQGTLQQCPALNRNVLNYTAIPCTLLSNTDPYWAVLPCTAQYYCPVLHCTVLNYVLRITLLSNDVHLPIVKYLNHTHLIGKPQIARFTQNEEY